MEQGCQSVKLGKLFLEWVTVMHREGHILPRCLLATSRAAPGSRWSRAVVGVALWLFLLGMDLSPSVYPFL